MGDDAREAHGLLANTGGDASEYGSLLANTDRTASDSLVFELQPPPEPEPDPEPETQPLQRTASTEALIKALHARGFSAVERTSYVNRGGEKLRFSAVDREALDRELGSAATESAPDPELGGEEGDPVGFRFSRCTTEFYHGTSLEAALNIQDEGFCVDLSGSNAGKMLGPGLYCTTTLEKAVNYAKRMPGAGVIFRLDVDLGRCYQLEKGSTHTQDWHTKLGYDSCWSPAGTNGIREENCIADPSTRVRIVEAILGDTRQAQALGYSVDGQTGRLRLNEEQAAAAVAAGYEPRQWMSPQQVQRAKRKLFAKLCCFYILLVVFQGWLDDEDPIQPPGSMSSD